MISIIRIEHSLSVFITPKVIPSKIPWIDNNNSLQSSIKLNWVKNPNIIDTEKDS